jgi:hypothetical protein
LGIRVTRQGKGIGAATLKQVGVYVVDWDAFIFVGDVATLTLVIVVSQEEGF